jgi:hypothetical protein
MSGGESGPDEANAAIGACPIDWADPVGGNIDPIKINMTNANTPITLMCTRVTIRMMASWCQMLCR